MQAVKIEGAKWYEFYQNNSGGYHIQDDRVAALVYVQAMDAEQANDIFYDLSEDARAYCECCGERWEYVTERDGHEEPTHYGVPLSEKLPNLYGRDSYLLCHGLNGRTLKVHGDKIEEIGKLSNGV